MGIRLHVCSSSYATTQRSLHTMADFLGSEGSLPTNSQWPSNSYNPTTQPSQAPNHLPQSIRIPIPGAALGEVADGLFDDFTMPASNRPLTAGEYDQWLEEQIALIFPEPYIYLDNNVIQDDPSIEGDIGNGLSEKHSCSPDAGSSLSSNHTWYGRISITLYVSRSLKCCSTAECFQCSTPTLLGDITNPASDLQLTGEEFQRLEDQNARFRFGPYIDSEVGHVYTFQTYISKY
jgi:hypothetical protein